MIMTKNKPIVPLLNLAPKKKNSSPLKEEMILTAEGASKQTGPLPLIFQEFDNINRMPYVNSSRIHNPQLLTDRSEVNEIDKIVDKVNIRMDSDLLQIIAPKAQHMSAFFDNIDDDPDEDKNSSDESQGMEDDDDQDNGGTSSEDEDSEPNVQKVIEEQKEPSLPFMNNLKPK